LKRVEASKDRLNQNNYEPLMTKMDCFAPQGKDKASGMAQATGNCSGKSI
jgi:hypothetical protein